MTLNTLISIAASGYHDAQLLEYWDSELERPRDNHIGGDTLARFIVAELYDTFESDISDMRQIREAVRVLNNAADDIKSVVSELLDRLVKPRNFKVQI